MDEKLNPGSAGDLNDGSLDGARFQRSFADHFDSRFTRILAVSFCAHIIMVVYFLLNPISQDLMADHIAKLQQDLAKTIKQREELLKDQYVQFDLKQGAKVQPGKTLTSSKPDANAAKPAQKPDVKSKGKEKGSRKKGNPGEKMVDAGSPGDGSKLPGSGGNTRRRGSSKAKIAAAVSNRGVLALLTTKSGYASNGDVADVVAGSGTSGDLDKKIARLTSLQRSVRGGGSGGGGTGTGVRGGREQGQAGIDELVSGLGDAEDQAFERGGELVVSSETPQIEGDGAGGTSGRNPGDVQAVIMEHNRTIQYCYERELKRDPNLRGKMTVRFTIDAAGRVIDVKLVSSTLKSRSVERCVMNRIRRWNDFGALDASVGNTVVRQTYAFGY